MGKKWLSHFTKVTNVAPLLSALLCRDGLAACRGILIWLLFHYPFLFFNFKSRKNLVVFFIFSVQFKGDIVCILHMGCIFFVFVFFGA